MQFLNKNVYFGNNMQYFHTLLLLLLLLLLLILFIFFNYRNTLMLEEVKGILQIPSFLSL